MKNKNTRSKLVGAKTYIFIKSDEYKNNETK